MRITRLYVQGLAPFQGQDLVSIGTDDERVLMLGISGSGKSTALRGIAYLWQALGQDIQNQVLPPAPQGNIAMVLSGLSFGEMLVVSGDEAFLLLIAKRHPNAVQFWLGHEHPAYTPDDFSNIVSVDGEWHEAQPYENATSAWFITDDDLQTAWPEVLEKANANTPEQAQRALRGINALLYGKMLLFNGEGHLVVRIHDDLYHEPQHLSSGEKRICVMCVLSCLCLKEGGILLLDEPDAHIHPSQVTGVLATLEYAALDHEGQVFIISHQREVWQRYDALGLVVTLPGGGREVR